MQTYSQDLRDRVLRALERGGSDPDRTTFRGQPTVGLPGKHPIPI